MEQKNQEVECVDYLAVAGEITDPFEGIKLALEVMETTYCGVEYEVAMDEARRYSEVLMEDLSKVTFKIVDMKVQLDRNYNFESDPFIQNNLKALGDMYSLRERMRLKYVEFTATGKYHSIEV